MKSHALWCGDYLIFSRKHPTARTQWAEAQSSTGSCSSEYTITWSFSFSLPTRKDRIISLGVSLPSLDHLLVRFLARQMEQEEEWRRETPPCIPQLRCTPDAELSAHPPSGTFKGTMSGLPGFLLFCSFSLPSSPNPTKVMALTGKAGKDVAKRATSCEKGPHPC